MNNTPETAEPRDSFSADWLSLREPYDERARHQAARHLRLPARLKWLTQHLQRPLRVMDLGCGTGANLRWLAPHLAGPQEWLVVDHDEALLTAWPERFARTGTRLQGDARDLKSALRWPLPDAPVQIVRQPLDLAKRLHELPWQAADLVTASALIDLVSAAWLEQLVAHTRASGAMLLLSLSVDGRHLWSPADPDDTRVGHAFAAHQQRDKGFGMALGAQAVPVLESALVQSGYRVAKAHSDWVVDTAEGPGGVALYQAMVEGMGNAAREQSPREASRIQGWQTRRMATGGAAALTVGHVDLIAWPAAAAQGRRRRR
ncbi:MAG: class I SAM-dependent methyltransferase [Hydrogenophaga sp.]|jgi:SAM-dependent methyltransferase|nr:class I SAM-dependent methyltransferase [Hydrogenophaga sp.]